MSRSCPAKKPDRISKETNWVLISWVRSRRTGKYLVWAQQVPTERSEDIPNYNRSTRPHFDSWLSSDSTSFRRCLVAQCPKFQVHPCLRYLWIQYAYPFFECSILRCLIGCQQFPKCCFFRVTQCVSCAFIYSLQYARCFHCDQEDLCCFFVPPNANKWHSTLKLRKHITR